MEACCVHTEGEWRGKPFRLLAWQKRLLLKLFTLEPDPEWVPAPGQPLVFRRGLRRRYRNAFICIPKKNGKTELAAAIALYLLLGDDEPSPKGVFVAGSLKQAGISFRSVQTMILESPVLRQVVGERNVGDLVIEVPSIPGSRLERVAAEAGTNDGPSLSLGVLDEVHEYEGEKGVKTYGVVTNAGAARKNPLFVGISTVGADAEDEDQVWVDLYRRGQRSLLAPELDPTFFFYLAQAPDGADWQDRSVWEEANPSANETVSWSFYQSEWPKGETWCRRYYLNQPPGRSEDPWMDPDVWAACQSDAKLEPGRQTFVAVRIAHDHGSAAVAVAQRAGDQVVLRVRTFAGDELLDEDALDLEQLEDYIVELRRDFPARVMGAWRLRSGREHLRPMPGPEVSYHGSFFEGSAQTLRKKGLVMVDVPASVERIAPAAETLMGLALSRELAHDGDAELAHQVDAVVAKPVQKGWAIKGPSGSRRRIEAALASMVAVHRAMTSPKMPSTVVHGMRRR